MQTLSQLNKRDLAGKKVLVRVDFNVPIQDNKITDDSRIKASLKTIQYLINNNAKVILISHLGRPKGDVDEALRLTPIAHHLATLLNVPVYKTDSVIGEEVEAVLNTLKTGEIVLLENIRFHKEESKNDTAFAQKLATLADIFILDAFGASHRAHASTEGIAHFLPSYAGFLLEKEVTTLNKVIQSPERPVVAIVGGAKISSKFAVLENLLGKVDTLIIGGGMTFTLLKAQGFEIGKSLCENDLIEDAKTFLNSAKNSSTRIILPIDHITIKEFNNNSKISIHQNENFPADEMGVDVGPETLSIILAALEDAKTIIWNGPLGVFEMDNFAKGTMSVAKALAKSNAFTIIGGGDSGAAVLKAGVTQDIDHVSTGGGATLALLEGKTLPGIAILETENAIK